MAILLPCRVEQRQFCHSKSLPSSSYVQIVTPGTPYNRPTIELWCESQEARALFAE